MIAILPALFFIGGPDHNASRSAKHAWNLGHILYFALLPFAYFAYRKDLNRRSKRMICLPMGLALVAISFLLPVSKKIPIPLKIIVAVLVLTQLVPICIALFDEHLARRSFPILSDFQSPLQIDRWEGKATRQIQALGRSANDRTMRVQLSTDTFSGVQLRYFHGNWQSYSHFQFRIYNPDDEAITITCRIHDERHLQGSQYINDRFSKPFPIAHGWNTVTIDLKEIQNAPSNRQMDLHRIHGIGFFATQLPYPRTIFIDDIKLK